MGFFTNPRIDTTSPETVCRSMAEEQARRNAVPPPAASGCLMALVMLPAMVAARWVRPDLRR